MLCFKISTYSKINGAKGDPLCFYFHNLCANKCTVLILFIGLVIFIKGHCSKYSRGYSQLLVF